MVPGHRGPVGQPGHLVDDGPQSGGVIIGLVRSLGSQYVGEQWTSALVFAILILLLVFRPSGLLGARTREKV